MRLYSFALAQGRARRICTVVTAGQHHGTRNQHPVFSRIIVHISRAPAAMAGIGLQPFL